MDRDTLPPDPPADDSQLQSLETGKAADAFMPPSRRRPRRASAGRSLAATGCGMTRGYPSSLLGAAAVLAVVGCGADNPAPPPAVQAPAPGPTPAPSPSPTPSPVPGPTIAGVSPGGVLATTFVCAGISDVARTDNRITSIGAFGPAPSSAGYQSLGYQAADTFQFDSNGFGGTTFRPGDKRTPASATHDLFVHVYPGPSPSELQLWTATGSDNLEFATAGLLAENYDGGSLCFFAAGKQLSDLPTSNGFDYLGRADGVGQVGGASRRLQGSFVGLSVDFAARKGTVTLKLAGRENPFSDLTGQPFELGTLTGEVTLSGGSLSGTIAGANGISGSIRGQFFGQLAVGAGLVFELKDAAGRTAIGAAAADIRQI